MRTFVDSAGRTWTIVVNVFAIKRVRGLLNFDLYSLIDGNFEGLGKLLADPITLVDVLYCLCKDEADKLGVSDEDFGRAMWGDAISRASDAFLAEYTDFFPDPRVRAGLAKVMDKARRLEGLMMDRMETELDRLDVEDVARRLKHSSGRSPATSASTPDPSPSAS